MASHEHAHPGLEVTVDRTGPCSAKVKLEVSPEEYRRSREQGLRSIASRSRMKGFRPGKVPLHVVERQYGAEVDRDLLQHFLNHALERAVKEHELRPAASPRIDMEALKADGETGLSHEFELFLRPDIELGKVKGLQVEAQPTEVGEEEIDAAIEDLRQRQSKLEPAGDDGLGENGVAVTRLEYRVEGTDEPIVSREGIRMNTKSAPRGVDVELFEKAITGAKQGEERTFDVAYPEDFPEESVRNRKGSCTVSLLEVHRIEPASDEELHAALEVEGAEAFRAEVRKRLEEARAQAEEARIENELIEQVLAAHPIEVPQPLVEAQADAKAAELRTGLAEQGLSEEEIQTRVDEERPRTLEASEKALRAVYLMEEIAKRENVLVEEADVLEELGRIAERNGVGVDEVRKYYQEEGLFQQLGLELLERKVRSLLRSSADIRGAGA